MARMRTIKPEICESEVMVRVYQRSPTAEMTFARLWTYCDDFGKAKAHPELIKSAIYPLGHIGLEQIEQDIQALEAEGLVGRYEVDGKLYLIITNWGEHQHPQKPTKSRLPDPPETSTGSSEFLSGSSGEAPETPAEGPCTSRGVDVDVDVDGDEDVVVLEMEASKTDDDDILMKVAEARANRLGGVRPHGRPSWIRTTAEGLQFDRTRIEDLARRGLSPAAIDIEIDGVFLTPGASTEPTGPPVFACPARCGGTTRDHDPSCNLYVDRAVLQPTA